MKLFLFLPLYFVVDKNFILIFRNFEYSVATIVRPKNSENAAAKKSYMFF